MDKRLSARFTARHAAGNKITMAIPTAEDVVEEEGEVLAVIGAALQDACDKTHSFFSDHEEGAPDASLSPNLVRWFAKRYLDTAGHTTHTLATDYEREALGNNGLLVACTKYQIRVRKEVAGFALPPAASEALDTFYGQEQLELPFPNFQPQSVPGGAETSIKLVLLWDVDSDYRLSSSHSRCRARAVVIRKCIGPFRYRSLIILPRRAEAETLILSSSKRLEPMQQVETETKTRNGERQSGAIGARTATIHANAVGRGCRGGSSRNCTNRRR